MEACVEYFESAINAEIGGASRLELCSALSEGGLTPSVGLLRKIKAAVRIPVCVMIRPRTGNDFIYSQEELDIMCEDIRVMRENGADGLVFGVLNRNSSVDVEAMGKLMEMACGIPVTFHRAFDMVADPKKSLEVLISLGVARLLTSGQSESAFEGRRLIGDLVSQAKGRIEIMPGCGVNASNLEEILRISGARQFHATAREPRSLPLPKSDVRLGHVDDEAVIYVTSANKVKQLVEIFKRTVS